MLDEFKNQKNIQIRPFKTKFCSSYFWDKLKKKFKEKMLKKCQLGKPVGHFPFLLC
jgi:hypothetical protein